MSAPPGIVSPDETCDRALSLMSNRGDDHLIVCARKRVVGVLERRTLLDRVAALLGGSVDSPACREFLPLVRVSGVMSRHPKTVAPDDPIAAAAKILAGGGSALLPVVDGTGLVGMLTIDDLLASIAEGGLGETR